MKFGVHFQLGQIPGQSLTKLYENAIEQAVLAEKLGFESIWPVEQHFTPSISTIACPMMLLSAIAARTNQIRLGTGVTLLPLHHPLRVAEEIATLQLISKGRVEFGFGRGGLPDHFIHFGVNQSENRQRMIESLEIIQLALSSETFSYRGDYYTLENVSLSPGLGTYPIPPFRAAANSPDTVKQMAEMGYPIFCASHINPFPTISSLYETYQAHALKAGNSLEHLDFNLISPIYTAQSTDEIRSALNASLDNMKAVAIEKVAPVWPGVKPGGKNASHKPSIQEYIEAMSFERLNVDCALFETPARCIERLKTIQSELQLSRFICWFNPGGLVEHEAILDAMHLFAEEVIPAF
ncbi:luciferase-like monooxygenase [Oleiphilus messinensis]|uniref:Luciferase-like monooxygenase n=1 Tax=Oleiphilus messinensis TaxID=141451 RepID=A0A1Y0I6G3_9GAMM|nr:LLM class flavin-dependent oxidoreductase [Oleiphilus messinensis]ARU56087.1 luciferase-like monooxygenase [Oleiphilus messinensis]